ncbi:MAG: hypothetical protein IJS99_04010, partial [Synergistaceae bacterium]|nr:hypothetical protein [Synergistaceae bacterium]
PLQVADGLPFGEKFFHNVCSSKISPSIPSRIIFYLAVLVTTLLYHNIIITTLIFATVISNNFTASAINDLGFLSMSLRACVVFMPLTCALWLKKRISRKFILVSIILSPLVAILGALFKFPFEPLYLGMSISIICCVIGAVLV